MAIRQKEIENEFARGSQTEGTEVMQRFFDMAMMFKVLDKEAQRSKSLIEEEKKEEVFPAKVEEKKGGDKSEKTEKTDIFAVIGEATLVKPWDALIKDDKSGLATMVKMGPMAFTSKLKVLVDIANDLKLSQSGSITDFMSLPLVNGCKVLMAAILLQNVMQPQNSKRREAITSKNYYALRTEEEAHTYFSDMLSQNLKLELAGRESTIRASFV
jgi:hypothetical protein